MPTHETPADRIALSIVRLRNARAGLAQVKPLENRITFKARIDICEEMISRVREIDHNLRQLSSQNRRGPADATRRDDRAPERDSCDQGGVREVLSNVAAGL